MDNDTREASRKSRIQNIGKAWLRNRITVEQVKAKHLSDNLTDDPIEAARRLQVARLFGGHQWHEFLASVQEGDELWEFSSSDLSWNHLAGRAGIALVRNGEIFDCILTSIN